MLKDKIKNIIKDMPTIEQLELVNAFREGFNLSEIFLNTPEHIDRVLEGKTPSEVIHLMRLGFYDRNDLFVTYDEWDDSLLSGALFDIEDLDTMAREIIDNDLDLGCAAIRDALKPSAERDRLIEVLKGMSATYLRAHYNEYRGTDTDSMIREMRELDDVVAEKGFSPRRIAFFAKNGMFDPRDKFFVYDHNGEDSWLESVSNVAEYIGDEFEDLADWLIENDPDEVQELLK